MCDVTRRFVAVSHCCAEVRARLRDNGKVAQLNSALARRRYVLFVRLVIGTARTPHTTAAAAAAAAEANEPIHIQSFSFPRSAAIARSPAPLPRPRQIITQWDEFLCIDAHARAVRHFDNVPIAKVEIALCFLCFPQVQSSQPKCAWI